MTAHPAAESPVHPFAHMLLCSAISLNNGNSAPILRILEYFVVVLLWLFFFRVIRAVWVETRAIRKVSEHRDDQRDGAFGNATPVERRNGKGKTLSLRIIEPEEQRDRSFDLADELTIGRAAGCGISIDYDTFTSNLHARVFRRDRDVWVEDLGSTNGTVVDGKLLTKPVRIRKGDTVQVGGTIFEVVR